MGRQEDSENNTDRLSLSQFLKGIPSGLRLNMRAAVFFALLAYAYIFLNPIFIHDSSSYYMGTSNMEALYAGATRMTWLSGVYGVLQAGCQVPWFAGCISMVLYGLSSFFACEALKIRSELNRVFITGIMTVAPSVISSQMYGAGGLMFSLCMFYSSVAGWLIFSGLRWKWLWFSLLFVATTASYSPYICWIAVIFIIRQIRDLLDKETDYKNVWKNDCRAGLAAVCGVVVNIIVCKILIRVSEGDFQGRVYGFLGSETTDRGKQIRQGILQIVGEQLPSFLAGKTGRSGGFYSIIDKSNMEALLYYVCFLVTLWLIIRYILKGKSVFVAITYFVHLLLMYICTSVFCFFTVEHGLMKFAHIAPWIYFVTMSELLMSFKSQISGNLYKFYRVSVCAVTVFTIWFCVLLANVGYMKGEALFRSGVLTVNRIVDRIENIPVYKHGPTPIYFIGDLVDYGNPPSTPFLITEGLTGISQSSAMPWEHPFKTYLKEQVGLNNSNPVYYKVEPYFRNATAEEYFDALNNACDGAYEDGRQDFIDKFNATEDFPRVNNYFIFRDVLVFRLRTHQ